MGLAKRYGIYEPSSDYERYRLLFYPIENINYISKTSIVRELTIKEEEVIDFRENLNLSSCAIGFNIRRPEKGNLTFKLFNNETKGWYLSFGYDADSK